jgi:general secretion pathway protein K
MRTRKTTKTTSDGRRGQRGVALILVLWTFAVVAVLAAEFARAMRDEAVSTRNFRESTRARLVAIAALNEVFLAMQKDREQAERVDISEEEKLADPVHSLSYGDGQWVPASFRGRPYEVRVVDEAGKIGLNQVDATTLRVMFENLEIDEGEAEIIADSILDWRDNDDLHGPNGAESDYYENLPRPYHAKNAGFDSVEELLLVRGVTRELFYGDEERPGLRELFSVFNQTRTVNVKSVTPAVMRALGGYDEETAQQYGTSRRQTDGEATIDELRATLQAAGTGTRNTVPQQMTIEARVKDLSGSVILAHIGAVVNMSQSGDGLRVFRWYDSIFDDSDETAAPAGEPQS